MNTLMCEEANVNLKNEVIAIVSGGQKIQLREMKGLCKSLGTLQR